MGTRTGIKDQDRDQGPGSRPESGPGFPAPGPELRTRIGNCVFSGTGMGTWGPRTALEIKNRNRGPRPQLGSWTRTGSTIKNRDCEPGPGNGTGIETRESGKRDGDGESEIGFSGTRMRTGIEDRDGGPGPRTGPPGAPRPRTHRSPHPNHVPGTPGGGAGAASTANSDVESPVTSLIDVHHSQWRASGARAAPRPRERARVRWAGRGGGILCVPSVPFLGPCYRQDPLVLHSRAPLPELSPCSSTLQLRYRGVRGAPAPVQSHRRPQRSCPRPGSIPGSPVRPPRDGVSGQPHPPAAPGAPVGRPEPRAPLGEE